MPYIKQERRPEALSRPITAGELNFKITSLLLSYIEQSPVGELNYGTLNEIIGVLECAKLELYRRMGAPYEDCKKVENGDVYP